MKRFSLFLLLLISTSVCVSQTVGNGITVTNFSIEDEALNFTPTTVGTTATYDLLITNDVGVTQDIQFTGISHPFYLDTLESNSISLGPDQATVLVLSFSPTEVGNFENQLVFTGSIFGTGSLLITGEGTQIDIQVDTDVVQFENTAIGTFSTAEIYIENVGSGTMLISDFEFTDAQFSVEEEDLTVLEGEGYTLEITFTPTIAGGTNETLIIHSNDPDEASYEVALVGTGISEVEGELCGTWSLMNSPYTLTNDVTVPDSCSLTIEAGVVINGNNFDINADGPVYSMGTEDMRVEWNDVDLYMDLEGGDSASLRYSDMEYINIEADGDPLPFNFTWNDGTQQEWYGGGNQSMTNDNSRLRMWYWASCCWRDAYAYSPIRNYSGQLDEVSYNVQIDDYNGNGNGSEWLRFEVNIDEEGWQTIDQWNYIGDQSQTEFTFNLDSLSSNNTVQFRYYIHFYEGYYLYIDDLIMEVGQEERVTLDFSGLTTTKDFYLEGDLTDITAESMRSYYNHWDQENSTYTISNWIIEGHSDRNEGVRFLGNYNTYDFSHISLDNTDENDEQGLDFQGIQNSSFSFDSCSFNGFDMGLYMDNCDYSDFYFNECETRDNQGTGIEINSMDYCDFEIIGLEAEDNNGHGFYISGSYNTCDVDYSMFNDNSSSGFNFNSSTNSEYQDSLLISNSGFFRNNGYGIYTNNQAIIDHVTVIDNYNHGIYFNGTWYNMSQDLHSSILWGNGYGSSWNQVYVSTSNFLNISYTNIMDDEDGVDCSYCDYDSSVISEQPSFSDDEYHLIDYSPGVDGGRYWEIDAHMPMGMGGVRADMGMYGGPNNQYWGGDVIANGTFDLTAVEDIPDDQGNTLGLTFDASFWDNASSIDPVTHYTIWRHLDTNGEIINSIEEGNWELVGQQPAQGFQSYGYQAPTISNTNIYGEFNSCYTVIAQTAIDQLYWQSNVMCGQATDDLAPDETELIAGMVESTVAEITWFEPSEEDFAYTEITSDHGFTAEVYGDTIIYDETVFEGNNYTYYARHFDENGNASDYSEAFIGSEALLDIVTLNPGWNLISLDRNPYADHPSNVFSSLQEGNLEFVTGYENGASMYDPNGLEFLNTLNSIQGGKGYWVKVNNEDILTVEGSVIPESYSLPLSTGWNLVGFVPYDDRPIEIVYGDLIEQGLLEYVTGYNQGATSYNPNGLPFLNTLNELSNGYGYWVKTSLEEEGLVEFDHQNLTPIHDFINGTTSPLFAGNTISVLNQFGDVITTIDVLQDGHLMTTPVYGSEDNIVEGIKLGDELTFDINGKQASQKIVFDGNRVVHKVNLEFELPEIAIYPNPTSDNLHVKTNEFEATSIAIKDVFGRTIIDRTCKSNEVVNVQDFSAGVYSIELQNIHGASYKSSFVVQH